jgi:hypothetical protein
MNIIYNRFSILLFSILLYSIPFQDVTVAVPVGAVMTAKVVSQHLRELFLVVDVGTGGDEVTAGQTLVKGGIVSPVQLIDRHLPHVVSPAQCTFTGIFGF